MNFLNEYLVTLIHEPTLLILVGFVFMLFLGEPAVLAISFILATIQSFSIVSIIACAYGSAIIGEVFWFLLARSSLFDSLKMKSTLPIFSPAQEEKIQRFRFTRPLELMFWTRMFSGLTIFAIIYISRKGLSGKRFVLYSLLVNAFWTPLVVGIGYWAGKGHQQILATYTHIHYSLEIGLVVVLLIYILYSYVVRKLF